MQKKNTRAAPKKIAHILIYALFFVLLLFIPNDIVVHAEEIDPAKYNLKEVTEDEVNSLMIMARSDMTVYFRDSDDTIRMGTAYDVFRYLKEKNKNEINPQHAMKWRLINSQADKLDAVAFYAEANFGNANIINNMIDMIAGDVMQFTDSEVSFITKFYGYFIPIFVIMTVLSVMNALAEQVMHNKITMESTCRVFGLALIAGWMISKADKIATLFFSISNSFSKLMSDVIRPEKIDSVNVYSYENIVKLAMGCDGRSTWESIGKVSDAVSHILWGQVLLFIVLIILIVMTYSVKLRFALRVFFMPYALTTLPYKGKNSLAVKHIKKMGANALLAGIYIVILSFGIFYNSSFSSSPNQSSLALSFVMPFVILLCMKVADMIAEEVVNSI